MARTGRPPTPILDRFRARIPRREHQARTSSNGHQCAQERLHQRAPADRIQRRPRQGRACVSNMSRRGNPPLAPEPDEGSLLMDISETLAPNSDQLDAIELVSGPRVFTIASVTKGNAEQPVNVHFADFPRAWRPSKGMRRVLAACWGADASQWGGRRVELFFDPEVTFGKDKPGGTRISRLSDIDKPKRIPLLVSRGKSAIFTVDPLPEESRSDQLRREWKTADPGRRKAIEAEVAELTAGGE